MYSILQMYEIDICWTEWSLLSSIISEMWNDTLSTVNRGKFWKQKTAANIKQRNEWLMNDKGMKYKYEFVNEWRK